MCLKPPRALRAARRPLCALWQMCSLIATAIDITSALSTCRNTHNKVALHQRRTFRSGRSIQYLYWHCIPPELDTLIWQWTRGADHPPPPWACARVRQIMNRTTYVLFSRCRVQCLRGSTAPPCSAIEPSLSPKNTRLQTKLTAPTTLCSCTWHFRFVVVVGPAGPVYSPLYPA